MKTSVWSNIAWFSVLALMGCRPVDGGYQVRSVSDASGFWSLFFVKDTLVANLECPNGSTNVPISDDKIVAFPDSEKWTSFSIDFSANTNFVGQSCYVWLGGTVQDAKAGGVAWLAQKNGSDVKNVLFISDPVTINAGDTSGSLIHKAVYYRTFDILTSVSVTPSPTPTDGTSTTAANGSPYCQQGASIDINGDGWGNLNGVSCVVRGGIADVKKRPPSCTQNPAVIDPDHDGWGYENGVSCLVPGSDAEKNYRTN